VKKSEPNHTAGSWRNTGIVIERHLLERGLDVAQKSCRRSRRAKFTGGMKNLWQGSQSRLASLDPNPYSLLYFSPHSPKNFFIFF
jgi:hypothetical protein